MFNEWYKPDSYLEFPKGGSQAIVQALVRYLLPPSLSFSLCQYSGSSSRRELTLYYKR